MTKLVRHSNVGDDHKIELELPELAPGTAVEVIILVNPSQETTDAPTLQSFLGVAKGTFRTPEEADAFLRAERDKWEQ